jgi:ribosomal protein S18 acetylase RimI-like enzyme
MSALYEAEAERWSSVLEWETREGWAEVERGRMLGTVSGLVVDDDQGHRSWCYYLVHGGALQIGGLVAHSETAAQLMLERILQADALAAVDRVSLFAFSDAPGLAAALRARGLTVDRYWYLARDFERRPPARTADVRQWRPNDLKPTAELLARSYARVDESRPFAPRGRAEDWLEYASQIASGPGCGTLLPQACFVVPGGPDRLLAVVLVTRIGPTTAHLVQLAVDPQLRGGRVGAGLVAYAASSAAQAGCGRLTLLVSARNSPARGLYEMLRFETVSSFLSAGTLQPRRSTSVAPSGVAITRR